jgi:hypothetical protein
MGDSPTSFLKKREKEVWSANPTLKAMSLMLSLSLMSRNLDYSMLTLLIQYRGGYPLTFFTVMPKWLGVTFRVSA